ncbi:metallopeptidase family protein [Nocardioides limicola]|uniref:metallopeptidase family protein n=1 Tax=Nocardioides limicola TaxID=2803368 RepID=UPI00193AEF75|nr:metallopeptidase family protein [Nocardioides sp. DJM-14]
MPRPRLRDRHGRGLRGPGVWPSRPGTPQAATARERFDEIALRIVTEIDRRWSARLGRIEYAVEDVPQMPEGWQGETVPLSSLVPGSAGQPTRLVLFRRPIEHRAEDRVELEALVHTVVVEQVAELLGIAAEDVDPRYRD